MQAVPLVLEAFKRGNPVVLLDAAENRYLVFAEELASAPPAGSLTMPNRAPILLVTIDCNAAGRVRDPNLPFLEVVTADPAGVLSAEAVPEAAIDIARMAGLSPRVLLCKLLSTDGNDDSAVRTLPSISISDLVLHRQRHESDLELVAVADLPTPHSDRPFRVHSFTSTFDGQEHLALVSQGDAIEAPLVRLHSECLTGDAFGSLRCDCGPQLDESLSRIAVSPGSVLIYLRGHEGRGIGLANKIRAYALQDTGLDTVEANRALGLPDDARDYAHAATILRKLGHQRIRLLTNNPEKANFLQRHGITIESTLPLIIKPNPFNARYLATKVRKFGHTL